MDDQERNAHKRLIADSHQMTADSERTVEATRHTIEQTKDLIRTVQETRLRRPDVRLNPH